MYGVSIAVINTLIKITKGLCFLNLYMGICKTAIFLFELVQSISSVGATRIIHFSCAGWPGLFTDGKDFPKLTKTPDGSKLVV